MLFRSLLGRDIALPKLNFTNSLTILPWFLLQQVTWASGFYFLAQSMSSEPVSLLTATGFPLAAAYGIIAIVAPGGVGVREGILVGYLVTLGFTTSQAATVAVASRLWFLIGEAFVFFVGYLADKQIKYRAVKA